MITVHLFNTRWILHVLQEVLLILLAAGFGITTRMALSEEANHIIGSSVSNEPMTEKVTQGRNQRAMT